MDGPKYPFVDNLKFDPSLRLSDGNFVKKLEDGTRMERRSKEQRLRCVIAYPDTLDFARFASAAYQEWGTEESPSDYEKRLSLPRGWRLLTTATGLAFGGTIYGYFGAAYWQPARRRVVIAHRGTVLARDGMKFKNLDAVRADLMGIVGHSYVKQMNAACSFADKIRGAVEEVERERQTSFEIFFTGHSLGAWLAQVTTFSLKYLTPFQGAFVKNKVEGYHAHTVVFDSPGCKVTIEKMIEDLDVRYAGKSTDAASLDITSYLSSPNFVNCCNPHVGKLYRLYPKITSHDYVSYTKSSHSMKAILETLQTPLRLKEVVDWPQIEIDLWQWKIWKIRQNILGKEYRDFFQFATDRNDYDPSAEDVKVEFELADRKDENSKRFVSVRYQTKPARTNECAFNVFNHFELEFLQRFQQLKYIPNCVFDRENMSEELRNETVENLNNMILDSKEKTVRCEAPFDVYRLIPYVKTLLRLYPDLNGFEIRKQIYVDITGKYRQKMQRLTNVLLPSDWPQLVHFLDNDMSVCHVLAQCGTDSAMAKVLKVIEKKAKPSTLFAFELRNLDTTETFFHLTEFLKSSDKLRNVIIAIECEAGSFRNEENISLVKKLQREVMNKQTNAKLLLITDRKDKFNPEDNSERLCHGGVTWAELTNEAQTETMSINVITFQENSEKICLQNLICRTSLPTNLDEFAEILDPETLTKFLKGEDINVGLKIPAKADFYIPRRFKYNPYIKEEVFHNERQEDVVAVWQHSASSMSTVLANSSTKPNFITVTSNQEFEKLCESNPGKNVHCLKLESSSVVWHKTKGSFNLLRKNIRDESLEYSVETSLKKLEDAANKTFIVSDAPGMGKSTVLAVLAQKMKERTPNHWVIRVNLNDCAKTLNDAVEKEMKLNNDLEAAKFLSEQILSCSENTILKTAFERKLFEKCLTSYGRIVLILDAFDEISPDYEGMVMQLLEKLRKSRLEKFVLSTRPHTKEQLEDQLATLSHTMAPFSRDDQKEFLKQFWENRLNGEAISQMDLDKRADEWVDRLKKSINTEDGDFLGIPLQCELLAEYTIDKIKNAENDPETKELSLMDLYEAFDTKKIKILQEEKNSLDDGNIVAKLGKVGIETLIRQSHTEYALRLMLSQQKWDELEYPEINENIENYIETAVQKAGLMLKTGDNPQFVHRTLADFYTLDYILDLSRKSEKNKRKLSILSRETLLQPEFGVLRILLDGLIRNEQKQDETTAFLRNFVQFIAQNWIDNQTLCLNGNGETLLHVLLLSKNYSVFHELLQILIEMGLKEILKSLIETPGKDSLLALHIASSHGHLDTVRSLVNHGANINGLEEDGRTPLLAASENGHLEVVRFLFEKGADNNSSDNNGTTPIIIASLFGRFELVRFLFEKGADINSGNNKKRTPIIAASWNGHLEVFRFLFEKVEDINSSDEDGITPIIAASLNGHLDVVRFLSEKGAAINSADNDEMTPIIWASLNGHLEVVRFLFEKGADINSSDNDGITPIIWASWNGHLEVVRFLFEKVGDINSGDDNERTPIIAASWNGYLEVVRFLFEKGADVNPSDNDERTPIFGASYNGHLEVVRFLFGKVADINSADNFGLTPIIAASCNGHLEVVRFLFEKGADINSADNDERTPIFAASLNGHLEVVSFLFEKGAEINSSDNFGLTPISEASWNGHLEVVRFLFEKLAAINSGDDNERTPIIKASFNGHLEVVRFLFEKGADINSADNDGKTPIIEASLNGYLEVVRFLFEKGADINSSDNDERTPIIAASWNGHLEVVRFLFGKVADINSSDTNERTPIIAASWNGHLEVVRFLYENGADINSSDDNERTPIIEASLNGHQEVVRFLSEKGADINSSDNNERTAIIEASLNGHLEVVRFLFEKGAAINSGDNNERTPIIEASFNGHLEVVRFLFEKGADINSNDKNERTAIIAASFIKHVVCTD